MAHKGTSSSVRNASKKPTQKNKPKTTKKAAANATAAKKKKSSASSGTTRRKSSSLTKTASKPRTASRTTTASRRKTPAKPVREPMNPKVKSDIFLTGCLLFTVLLLLSNFGICGKVGELFASFFFGLFGAMEFIFPVLFFVFTLFCVANKSSNRKTEMIVCFFLCFVFICSFVQMITNGYQPTAKILDFYSTSSFDRSGGGLFGGIVVFGVGKAFGKVGCYIVSLFGIIITLCLATQRPLVSEAALKGMLAKQKISKMRDRSLRKKNMLDEFDDEGDEDVEDYTDSYDEEEEEEIRPIRRSGIKGPSFEKPERKAKVRNQRKLKPVSNNVMELEGSRVTIGEQQSINDNMFFDTDFMKPVKPSFDTSYINPIEGQLEKRLEEINISSNIDPVFNTVDPEIFVDPDPVFNAEVYGKNIEEEPFPESIDPVMTINASEGAGSLEKVQVEDTYNPYDQLIDVPSEENSGKQKKKKTRSDAAELAMDVEQITEAIEEKAQIVEEIPYQLPPLTLLKKGLGIPRGDSTKYLKETAATLEQVLRDFGVNVQVTDVSCGPSVTRYELKPEQGVKVSRIVNLADDIKLNLAASNIRIEAPIPGKAAVGIEVPNKTVAPVFLRDLLESTEFTNHPSKIAFAVGKDIAGKTVVTDIARMPHLLIAGATGSGKSVCINTLIMSILYKASPDEVKLLMIDPKVVELSVYNGIPHLAIPVVTDPKKAAGALNWAVAEMSDRYNKFAEYGVRDVAGYNSKVDGLVDIPEEQKPKKMPQIVIVVDELADLMMVAPGEVEDAICRLAQLARAAGIHLIIATQRPSVNVVTGLIKANMPSRIALSVASGVDSRTILDMNGAEKLLGHGDMLFYPQGYTKPARVQGGFVSDDEISEVVRYLTESHGEVQYDASIEAKINSSSGVGSSSKGSGSDQDDLFIDAAKVIIDKDKASIGMLQRQFKIGFNRAARIMDQLCDAGVVGAEEGTKPRKVLMSKEQFENYLEDGRL